MSLTPASEPGMWKGCSLFDGAEVEVGIEAHPDVGLIDFHLGPTRVPRISLRVAPGTVAGLDEGQCVVALQAWRNQVGDLASWVRTCVTHEAEILLIKSQLETAYAGLDAPGEGRDSRQHHE
jgi:hypothetical protein